MHKIEDVFKKSLDENIKTHRLLASQIKNIEEAINIILFSINNEGKILLCGNGGSAADAQHLAAEFLVRLKPNINRSPIPAISLAQDISTITACGNDYSFSDIFLRTFRAFHKKNDVLIAISTSGNSKNVIKVLREAKRKNIKTVGFFGNRGGICKNLCDVSIIVSSRNTARIQESHIFLGHFIFEQVEKKFMKY